MQISELCRSTGLTKDTIRFYEKIGLLQEVKRQPNGYKDYSDAHVKQLTLLKHAKELGFTLNEIKELAALLYSRQLTATEMTGYLRDKEQEIDDKIAKLTAFKREIRNTLAGNCEHKEQLVQASDKVRG